MKQVEQNYRSGKLRVAEVPAPRADAGSLLVATKVSLISSGTEKQLMDLAKASLAGKAMARPDLVRQVLRAAKRNGLKATAEKVFAKLDQPIPLGYSLAGEVLEVGRNVQAFTVGERVACAGAGVANHAEINAVPKNLSVRIPESVTDEQASFVTLGAIALQGIRQAAPTLGERVVVMGLGLIGLLAVQLLKANGCKVLGFDPNEERTELARKLGADGAVSSNLEAAVADFTGGVGADAVIVAASSKSNEPLNTAGEISRMKGRVVVVGLVGMTIDREIFYKRELELKLSMSYGPGRYDPDYELLGHDYPLPYVRWTEQRNMEAFLALVAEGKVTPEILVSHRLEIARAEDAYDLMGRGEPHLAILLGYPETPEQPIRRQITRSVTGTGRGPRVGFIGLGNYAKSILLPAIRKLPEVQLTLVATATGISADNAGRKYGFTTVATDPAAVIGADDTDTIFIATHHDSHAEYVVRALQAGKNVFVEKPLALTLEELDRVVEAAETAPGLLAVGFNRRFAPMVEGAKDALAKVPGPKVMLYRVNAGDISSDSWIYHAEQGGRIVGEVCHFVDTLCHLSGSLPVEVKALAARDHPDAATALLRFADGSTGTIVYSPLGDPSVPKEYIEVFGRGIVVQLSDFTRLDITEDGRTRRRKSAQNKGQKSLVAAFIKAVTEGGVSPTPLNELAAVTEVTFAIKEALRQGADIHVDK